MHLNVIKSLGETCLSSFKYSDNLSPHINLENIVICIVLVFFCAAICYSHSNISEKGHTAKR